MTLTINLGLGLSPLHEGGTTHHLFARSRTHRIRHLYGFGLSTVRSISPLRAIVDYGLALSNFHEVSVRRQNRQGGMSESLTR